MLLFISLLVFISESSGFYTSWSPATVSLITTPSVDLRPLQVEAVPDYPVTAGQTVTLFCSSVNSYIWQHLVNLNWQDVGQDGNLTLTQPQQSGLYRCRARTTSLHISRNLTVNIEPTVNTVKKDLAEPAFVLSLLGFVISLGIVGWLLWGKFSNYISTSTKTEAKEGLYQRLRVMETCT
ncbi:uncharacterized protein LOC107988680 isoform X2 [Cynoglossus semilaevis]|uniref:uncharacterized protein LOC107988680 isoform X2 n=1 Tax=Cynoglossus semilaevis TaxID=244447 RepID=UPI000D623284|nr:uncharacterized protein LOC107988680 isoform X2 [Cynoglossus semilaevis]